MNVSWRDDRRGLGASVLRHPSHGHRRAAEGSFGSQKELFPLIRYVRMRKEPQ